MRPFRKKLASYPLIQTLSSLNIMITGLILLFILVFWGTIAQINSGLYQAQERFFHSFVFFVFGWLPFPGAQLVLWVIFVNLVCVAITRFVYRWSKVGIIIIHVGLLLYFVAAFVTLHVVEESHLTLREGETSNVSSAYANWEVSVWKEDGGKKKVIAFDADKLHPGSVLDFSENGFRLVVKSYYPNSEAYTVQDKNGKTVQNRSGIQSLNPVEVNHKEPEKNVPGGVFSVEGAGVEQVPILLYGNEDSPLQIKVGSETYNVLLRHKRFSIPVSVKLLDFERQMHPDTDVPRSFKSKVEIDTNGLKREVVISMNNPLRYKEYTLYQASYSIDAMGREYSTFAVAKNAGRILPYVASLTTFLGMAVHFLMMAFAGKRKRVV